MADNVEFDTVYDRCSVSEGVLSCLDNMNNPFATVILGHSASDLHFCVVVSKPGSARSNVLSCSGAMVDSALRSVNPLSEDPVDTEGLRVYESDFFYRYLYRKDVRTEFEHDVSGVACSNMETCVSFFGGYEGVCFGMDKMVFAPGWTFFVSTVLWLLLSGVGFELMNRWLDLPRVLLDRRAKYFAYVSGLLFFLPALLIIIIGVTTLVPPFAMAAGVIAASMLHALILNMRSS